MPTLSTTSEAEALAARAAELSAQIDQLSAQKKAALDALLTLHDLGRVDSKLQTPDGWTLQWSAGRQAYDYPDDIAELEANLQAAREVAVTTGRATPKTCTPFWTVRKPRPGKEAAA